MITGVKPDFISRAPETRSGREGAESKSSAAEGLDSAFSRSLKDVDRTERKAQKPGRADMLSKKTSMDREGERSAESESTRREPIADIEGGDVRQTPERIPSESPQWQSRRTDLQSERRDAPKELVDEEVGPQTESDIARFLQPQQMAPAAQQAPNSEAMAQASAVGEAKPGGGFFVGAPLGVAATAALTKPIEAGPVRGPAQANLETLEMLQGMKAEQNQVRTQAMAEFMNAMQGELGVKPERILEAFARMDEASLMAPPEESAQQFLTNLELQPQQQTRAGELYKQMLRATGEASLNEKLIGLESGVNFDVVSPRDQALRTLNQSIDDLNNAFAVRNQPLAGPMDEPMRAQMAVERMDAQLAKLVQARKLDAQAVDASSIVAPESEDSDQTELAALAIGAGGAEAGEAALASSTATEAGSIGAAAPSMGAMSVAEMDLPSDTSDSGLSGGSGGEASFAERMLKSDEGSFNVASEAKAMKKPAVSAKSAPTASASESASASGEVASTAASNTPNAAPVKVAAGPAGMMLDRPVPTAQDEQANVRELIRQAQLVLKKGGGEVKMDLKPEGMGQVRLKVSLDDGQVNVQMLTESDSAKRLLEKGLHELKADLAGHNLKVESMKVDISREMQKHMEQQADEQARQQARQNFASMMGQFREERQAFNQGFMENQGFKQHRQDRRDEVQPETVTAASRASRYGSSARAGNSSRLNLVA